MIVLWGKQKGERMDYRIVNSCMFPLGDAAKSHIVTIEGINRDELHPIQQAFVDENVSQCGFCTPGFIISMLGYLLQAEHLDTDNAKAFLSGNICRCTGYSSIIRATEKILAMIDKEEFHNSYPDNGVSFLVKNNFLPEYFANIFLRLTELPENRHEHILIDEIIMLKNKAS